MEKMHCLNLSSPGLRQMGGNGSTAVTEDLFLRGSLLHHAVAIGLDKALENVLQ